MALLRWSAAAACAFIIGCGTDPITHLPSATWGAQGAQLVSTSAGADVSFNCASGEIDGPLALEGDGSFTWTGTYTRIFPAPGTPPDSPHAATYTGVASQLQLTMTVSVPDLSFDSGTFTLSRDQAGTIALCP